MRSYWGSLSHISHIPSYGEYRACLWPSPRPQTETIAIRTLRDSGPSFCMLLRSRKTRVLSVELRSSWARTCRSWSCMLSYVLHMSFPEGPSTRYLRFLVPQLIPSMVFAIRHLRCWILGFPWFLNAASWNRIAHPCPARLPRSSAERSTPVFWNRHGLALLQCLSSSLGWILIGGTARGVYVHSSGVQRSGAWMCRSPRLEFFGLRGRQSRSICRLFFSAASRQQREAPYAAQATNEAIVPLASIEPLFYSSMPAHAEGRDSICRLKSVRCHVVPKPTCSCLTQHVALLRFPAGRPPTVSRTASLSNVP